MAKCTHSHSVKRKKLPEVYKNIWMTLFDLKVLSSCNEKDSDLFCASALLKTAFYQFINLKKQLNQTQEIVEAQKVELETLKLENENLKSSTCEQCLKLDNGISLSIDDSSQLEPYLKNPDKLAVSKIVNQTWLSEVETHLPPVEIKKVQVDNKYEVNQSHLIAKFDVSKTHASEDALSKAEILDLGIKCSKEESINYECDKKSHLKEIAYDPSRFQKTPMPENGNSSISKDFKNFKTPDKNFPSAFENQSVSPILKQSKKSRFSPGVLSRSKKSVPPKSPSLLSSESELVNEIILKKDPQEFVKALVDEVDPRNVFNPKKKAKLSSLSLKRKPNASLTKFTVAEVNVSIDENNPENADCESHPSPEEEADIIMPSPSRFNNSVGDPKLAISLRKTYRVIKNQKSKSKCKQRMASTLLDSDVTYFVPMENQEALGTCCKDAFPELSHNQAFEDEERAGQVEEVIGKGRVACEDENSSQVKESNEPQGSSKIFLCSFERLPLKKNSPPYKYQRAAVRKKDERRKLFGWECKDCQKYYEVAGHGMDSEERKMHLNKCSRHRDKFSPRKNTPKGFWDPLFPDTPE